MTLWDAIKRRYRVVKRPLSMVLAALVFGKEGHTFCSATYGAYVFGPEGRRHRWAVDALDWVFGKDHCYREFLVAANVVRGLKEARNFQENKFNVHMD